MDKTKNLEEEEEVSLGETDFWQSQLIYMSHI